MQKADLKLAEDRLFARLLNQHCVLCGRKMTLNGGLIQTPRDRRPAGPRCTWCYKRYLRRYFPEAL